MRNYTIAELKTEFKRLNYQWLPFQVVGIRSKENKPNAFDDIIGIIQNDTIKWYTCTTNAGTYWLLHPENVSGTAVLKCNQYLDSWALGLHQGKYKALKQIKPISVWRDNNHNAIAEEKGNIDTGMFGINIHRANEFAVSTLVEKWSAGCQVLNNPKDFKEFLGTCEKSKLNFFTYSLLNEF